MKKHSSVSRKNVMKKKTKHKIKLDRIRRDRPMTETTETAAPVTDGDFISDLKGTEKECRTLIATAAEVGVMLKNKTLVAEVENKPELIRKAQVFAKDVVEFHKRLNNITEKVAELDSVENNEEKLLGSLNVGQAYQEWLENYQSVVVPNQLDIAATLGHAAEKLATPTPDPVATPTTETTNNVE